MTGIDYTSVILDLKRQRDEIDALLKGLQAHAPRPARRATVERAQKDFETMTLVEKAETILQGADEPLLPKEIVDRAVARGYQSKAKDPASSMRRALRNDSRFAKFGESGAWGLEAWNLSTIQTRVDVSTPEGLRDFETICGGEDNCNCHCHEDEGAPYAPDCACWVPVGD